MELKDKIKINEELVGRWARGENISWIPSSPQKVEVKKTNTENLKMPLNELIAKIGNLAEETKEAFTKYFQGEGRVDRGPRYEDYKRARKLSQELKHLVQTFRNDLVKQFQEEQKKANKK
jgi:hypothetical protein